MKSKFYFYILSTLLFFSCDDYNPDAVLNIPIDNDITTLDPAKAYDAVSLEVIGQGLESLYEYHYLKRPFTLRPQLAESLPEILENGLVYKIKIKQNIRYHDDPCFAGKERFLKAEDFINQIKRVAFRPLMSSNWSFLDGKIEGLNKFRETVDLDFSKFYTTKISGLEASDDHTLIVRLTRPSPQFVYLLAMAFTGPMPKEAIDFYNNDLSERLIGTGPFYLKEWNKSLDVVELRRFKNFRDDFYPNEGDRYAHDHDLLNDAGKKLPLVAGINFHIIKEASSIWLKLILGKIDLVIVNKDNVSFSNLSGGDLSPELKKKDIKIQANTTLTSRWLSFNMKDKILGSNRYLRLAMAHAIDTDKYIQIFTDNTAQKANSIYIPGIPGYDPSRVLPYEYNLEKAKEYMALAGYPEGKNLPPIKFDLRTDGSRSLKMADFIKKELSKIGIKINIISNTFPEYLKKSQKGNLQFYQDGWSCDYPDAENIAQLLITKSISPGPNANFYSNPEVDLLFDKLALLGNDKEKFSLMKEIEDIVNHDVPWIVQYYNRNYSLNLDKVKNFRYSDLITNRYKYLKVLKR